MMGPSVYGPQKNTWRGRRHCQEAEDAYSSLTEAANNGARMFPPETYENQAKEIEQTVAAIQERGKMAWAKDHTFCVVPPEVIDTWLSGEPWPTKQSENPTPFSREFLDGVTPVILFRHPALTIPSW
ncbi:uncharacterized protein LTR77_009663 [Saxophila tyrrhenica]|uniref:Uncharacterized protein n=1 Tax=Saxophila tyrrhenica TaxID=1690608 RepID=A0AAV9NWX8_9PEZI|nr:hypothetical protein LTR77_009663 [Saxophila tyrrhenica]